MKLCIQQSIRIQTIKIESMANSAVLQIGSSGIIKPTSHLHNTGGFTEPAPQSSLPNQIVPRNTLKLKR